jgi:hypothetical protein
VQAEGDAEFEVDTDTEGVAALTLTLTLWEEYYHHRLMSMGLTGPVSKPFRPL